MKREELMAKRMGYLRTALKELREEISTYELFVNANVLRSVLLMEYQLQQMEMAYVGAPERTL